MIEHSKNILSPVFLLLQDPDVNAHRTKHMVECIRNCLFEYEKYEKDYMQMGIIELLCRVLVKEHGLTQHSLPESWMHLKGIATKEKFATMIDIDVTKDFLDGLMLLANSKTFLNEMNRVKIYNLFECLKIKPFGETRTKIDVINAQIMSIGMDDLPLEAEPTDLD